MASTVDPKEKFYRHFRDSIEGGLLLLAYLGLMWYLFFIACLLMTLLSSSAVLQDQIGQLAHLSSIGGERQEATDHILAGISKLQNEVADAAEFTPAYDRRQYSDVCRPS